MDFKTFESIVKTVKKECPLLFELDRDRIPSMEEVLAFQERYQVQLPERYIQFLLHYGGGYFGYANIYSLDSESCFYLGNFNEPGAEPLLYIADNECGDYYAFPIRQGRCQDEVVLYDHDQREIQQTEYSDILDYLVKTGLKRV